MNKETVAVKVKALEWTQKAPPVHDHEPFVYWAAGIGGHYRAERGGVLWYAHDAFHWEQFGSQKGAKAAAQADYEARILSNIELAPVKAQDDLVEAARAVMASWDKPGRERETLKNYEGRDYWSPIASMVESQAISLLRDALAAADTRSALVAGDGENDLRGMQIALEQSWVSNRERQAQIVRLVDALRNFTDGRDISYVDALNVARSVVGGAL